MKNFSSFTMTRQAIAALALLGLAAQAHADNLYHVVIDATQFAGSGWLDLQFNPGQDTAPSAFAFVKGFTGELDNSQAAQVSGSVTGDISSQVNFSNSTAYNDLFQAVKFGQRISFDVSFAGPFLNSSDSSVGSSFGVALYGSDQVTVLGNGDAGSGSLLTFNLVSTGTPVGNVTPVVFDAALVNVSAVPEASEWMMLMAGLGVMGVFARRRKAQQA
ncbi:MAG: hypothetical protein RL748_1827 [Pseudomonadota bacterium]|jgi:hypothetical protein